ncbi:hypothetical protein BV25DRAFT_1987245 [Artomyces pyxidatus]|uniref:Uncharacterized protein n=1 Tax=Artomyces pyxidatus TaxID=48021 RepID=A0ACB8TJ56_9AGAM|nr:hypothetical protein BV25DRAFT_1987245 [Artomyces pyxidatus]
MARLATFLALLSISATGFAIDVSGVVQWNEHCADFAELGHAKVILDNGIASGSILRDGRFVIPDVDAGVYVASVVSHDHQFDQLRIDVPSEADSPPEIRPYTAGTPLNPPSAVKLAYPIKLVPRQRNKYFVPVESFNMIGMFQNPMMLMMLFGGAMMLGMPYLMKQMDPEMLQEFKENQAKMTNFQNSIQSGDIKSGLSSLMAGDEPQPAVAPATTKQANPSSTNVKNRGNKKRRS